ncbi:MAG TPA: hypothetical protein EYG87_02200 [Methanothermococcus okinawensis]|uniref:Uncharacterized protein n=1 Tax=Methanofervidicoccus abyssi TaxID=2082189 RepID=A0A401HPC2_9EURY|nr:hypothetical protein [Methanofervidicoccus abyssi]GBF36001.1 hypothetical protein MHHB_P0226 [Methanofervidicoccus abyssi]HIP34845.1 hypothetical protein [Methanothermococcus okinawensis]
MGEKIKSIDNSVILKSMKDVFESEIVELEKELKELYEKYNIKSSREMELIECKDEEMERDFNRMVEIEDNLERLRKCLRDLNLKTI